MDRICLRKAALRALCSPPSNSARSRPITTLTRLNLRLHATRPLTSPLQRRWASEELTQSEPSADRETEAQYGENSIAKSSEGSTSEVTAAEPSSESGSPSVTEAVKSAANDTKDKAAEAAREAVGAASNAASSLTGSPSEERQAVAEKEVTRTLYVGNLFFDVDPAALEKEFSKAGKVMHVKIIQDQRGLSKGFGYVEFESLEEADRAIDMFNMQPFEGRRLNVQYTIQRNKDFSGPTTQRGPREPHAPTKTLFIGNMAFDMSDRDLNNLFRGLKNVADVRVAIDRRTGQPRGFAHADFVDVTSAELAFAELAGKEVNGRFLRVDFSASSRDSNSKQERDG